jgi:hypothetical protein
MLTPRLYARTMPKRRIHSPEKSGAAAWSAP